MARVLLLEPDRLLSQIYVSALERAGHQAYATATAQDAINLADNINPDIVVLELQLVEHSGIEFLYEFRSYVSWQSIPVVVHSNVPADEFAASQSVLKNELGVRAYLYKPAASLQQLTDCINDLVPLNSSSS